MSINVNISLRSLTSRWLFSMNCYREVCHTYPFSWRTSSLFESKHSATGVSFKQFDLYHFPLKTRSKTIRNHSKTRKKEQKSNLLRISRAISKSSTTASAIITPSSSLQCPTENLCINESLYNNTHNITLFADEFRQRFRNVWNFAIDNDSK